MKRKPLKQYRAKLYKKPTRAEVQFRDLLRKKNIKFIFQKQFESPKMRAVCDFFITGKRIVVELDGGVHISREAVNKDRYRTYWLIKEKNIKKVIRINNEDIFKFDFNKLK